VLGGGGGGGGSARGAMSPVAVDLDGDGLVDVLVAARRDNAFLFARQLQPIAINGTVASLIGGLDARPGISLALSLHQTLGVREVDHTRCIYTATLSHPTGAGGGSSSSSGGGGDGGDDVLVFADADSLGGNGNPENGGGGVVEPSAVLAVDIDGDGDLDLVTVDRACGLCVRKSPLAELWRSGLCVTNQHSRTRPPYMFFTMHLVSFTRRHKRAFSSIALHVTQRAYSPM
jgi:hypothetical protein